MAASGSGSRCAATKFRRPAPQAGRRSSSSGRARVTIRMGTPARPLEHVVDEVEEPRVRPVEVLEQEDRGRVGGDPFEVGPPGGEQALAPTGRRRLDGQKGEQRRFDPAALAFVRHPRRDRLGDLPTGRLLVVGRQQAGPTLTISPSAQNVTPSPYAGDRPTCHVDLIDEAVEVLLELPDDPALADPRLAGQRHEVDPAIARRRQWKRSLSRRSSVSRPVNGASSVSLRFRPPRSATTRIAR